MALPRAGPGLVDPVAPGVTKPTLVSFPRFMRLSGSLRFGPALVIFAAVGSATFLFAHAPTARAECGTASSSPCPTPSPTPPIPVNAFISLDVTSGDPNTVINVTGGQFNPNEDTGLYWDQPAHVAGSAHADGNGNFNTRVKPFPGDAPGSHKLCASVQPNPCAFFTITAPSTPTPSPSPTESPSPSSSPGPVVSFGPTPSPIAASLSGFDVISKPPFVFLPLFGILGIALSLGYWVVSTMRRPRVRALPTAAVMHRAMRPDYSAGFGTAPPSPEPELPPSAWNEPASPAVHDAPAQAEPAPASPAEPEVPDVEWGPPVEWGTGSSDWGFPEPPPAPDDSPEAPQPGD